MFQAFTGKGFFFGHKTASKTVAVMAIANCKDDVFFFLLLVTCIMQPFLSVSAVAYLQTKSCKNCVGLTCGFVEIIKFNTCNEIFVFLRSIKK